MNKQGVYLFRGQHQLVGLVSASSSPEADNRRQLLAMDQSQFMQNFLRGPKRREGSIYIYICLQCIYICNICSSVYVSMSLYIYIIHIHTHICIYKNCSIIGTSWDESNGLGWRNSQSCIFFTDDLTFYG